MKLLIVLFTASLLNLAQSEWDQLECVIPNSDLYQWDKAQRTNFEHAHSKLGETLAAFARKIARGDQCISQESANEVDAVLWEFMLTLKAGQTGESLLN